MLTSEQRVLYARHLALPELGDAGQCALLASDCGPALDDPRAERVRRDYLLRAGLRDATPSELDPSAHASDPSHAAMPTVASIAATPDLEVAAAAVLGAFAAIERIKKVCGLAPSFDFPAEFSFSELP